MKKWKKVLSIALAAAMAAMLFAGCGGGSGGGGASNPGTESANPATESADPGTETSAAVENNGFTPQNTYKIGYNYFGPGSYALTTLANNQEYVIQCLGSNSQSVSDDFQVDKIVQDIENLISAGCDGLVIWLPADNLYQTVINMCNDAKVPFVFSDKVPSDPATIEACQNSEYFAGAVGPANAEYGSLIAQYALDKGYKSCIISTGAQGDPTDTPRIDAFTAAFEAGGGKIEQVVYTDSQDNIQPYTENALVAYPDVDFVYGTGSDYGIGAADAIRNQGLGAKVLTSGLDTAILDYLVDESNPVEFVNGDYWISGLMSTVALMNYLDGNPLKDADGNAVFVDDIMPFEITPDIYDSFVATFIDNNCYSAKEIQAMDTLYNPDFNYDAFMKVIDDYSLEERAAAK